MCGIAGEIRFDGTTSNLDNTREMCRLQLHRGPDDDGFFAEGPVSLGIRRLAIIDLTKGLYPITNETRDLQLVFNGEIYGYQQLRNELIKLGHQFSSNTDSETVVHSYEEWGTDCVAKFNGMFAFALWDGRKQLLWLVRDHFGIKPLYYYTDQQFLIFASEIKPILGYPGIKYGPNENVIRQYLETGLVDVSEETFFTGIYRLMPAQYILTDPKGKFKTETYWKPSVSAVINGSPSAAEVQQTSNRFLEAIDRQIISDVSVGTCLSGGIDSSSIVCAIKKLYPSGAVSTGGRVRTFSSVFPGSRIDESEYISEVCERTQSEFNWVTPTADEFWNDLQTLVKCQEEPFISPSVYAQWRVMKLAKEHGLTVMLDGQGADELLVGYTHYYPDYLMTLKRRRKYLTLISETLRSFQINWPFMKAYLKNRITGTNDRKKMMRISGSYESRVRAGNLSRSLELDVSAISLPALLRYEDKNSMFHSLEARVPFLDQVLFDEVASLPLSHKLRNGVTKYVFRLAMKGILPEKILARKNKIGFEIPERRWIANDLRDRLYSFFDGNLLAKNYYDLNALRKLLEKSELSDGGCQRVWRTLNFEVWYQEFFANRR
jgi:asparagine synthase (glutamine-hydrolysing)